MATYLHPAAAREIWYRSTIDRHDLSVEDLVALLRTIQSYMGAAYQDKPLGCFMDYNAEPPDKEEESPVTNEEESEEPTEEEIEEIRKLLQELKNIGFI